MKHQDIAKGVSQKTMETENWSLIGFSMALFQLFAENFFLLIFNSKPAFKMSFFFLIMCVRVHVGM